LAPVARGYSGPLSFLLFLFSWKSKRCYKYLGPTADKQRCTFFYEEASNMAGGGTTMKPVTCTLVELIQCVGAYTNSDREVAATVAHLVNSGRVRLRGIFAGAKIMMPPARVALPTR
jgi:hypothetical protein